MNKIKGKIIKVMVREIDQSKVESPMNAKVAALMRQHEDVVFCRLDDLDDAIIGVCEESKRLIYSKKKMIEIYMRDDEMTEEDALDHYYYNPVRAIPYMGENRPIILDDDVLEEE